MRNLCLPVSFVVNLKLPKNSLKSIYFENDLYKMTIYFVLLLYLSFTMLFIPLFIISLFNLRRGIHINNTTSEIIFHILTMINIGFLEEMIFRGFLFKMMENDNVKLAIIVSSITFGIGHIVNLLNGADLIPTLLQVCYAMAIGYMLVIIFYKSKSLIPCIIFHGVFNSLSIFSTGESSIISSIILIAMCLGYTIYINKKVKA